jgi:hypothetical protein
MKLFFAILAFAICGGIAFYMINEENRKRRAEEYQRAEIERKREEERVEKERREDERIRKERMAALAKEDAVMMLQRYVTREENNLKDTIEECKLKLQSIDVDQQSLSDELLALEKEEELKAADAKKRKVKRRDANERVEALLRSPTLNRLANSYLGEDLSDDLAKFRSHIGNLTRISDEKTKRYAKNREKYQKSIETNDAEVDRLGTEASAKLSEARAKLNANVNAARRRVEDLRGRIEKLEKKAKLTTLNMNEKAELRSWREQLNIAEAQLTSAETTANLGMANKAHLDLTFAETKARRAGDTALAVRMDDDNAVEEEMNREADIYNAVKLYETRSLDRVREAMQRSRISIAEHLSASEKKLKYLAGSIANLDMLNADEIEALRKGIAKKLAEDVAFDPDKPIFSVED